MDKNEKQFRKMMLSCRDEGKESFIVEGYATTFDDPYLMAEGETWRMYEKVDSRAFDKCEKNDVIFQFDHEGRVFARVSNNTLSLSIDKHGLKVTADLGGTEEGRKLYSDIKGGYITRMSFCFTVRGESEESAKEENMRTFTRTITDISRLYDVSAVSIPANDGTEINARSVTEEIQKRIKSEVEAKEKQEAKENENKERERLALAISFEL